MIRPINYLRKSVPAFLFISSLFLIQGIGKAQNILEFVNVKDSVNIYKLRLGKFPVQLKLTDTIAFKVIIDDVSDSVLNVRVYTRSNAIDSTVLKLKTDYDQFISKQKRKRKYRDSLRTELDEKILAARYPTQKNIRISKIKTITIFNRYIPEKKKQMKLANAASILFLGATLLSASTQNPYYIGTGIGLTAIAFVAKSALSSKDLDLIIPKRAKHRKQWKIKGVKRA